MVPRPKHLDYESLELYDDDQNESYHSEEPKHLVLVGGGHAHVQVIKAMAARPFARLKVTLIDQQEAASYSGMVPGCIAKLYSPEETLLHLAPLAQWAQLEFVQAKVVDVDLDQKLIYVEEQQQQEPIPFDAMSLDIGSATRDLQTIPGALEHTIPTRPIADLVRRIQEAEEEVTAPLHPSLANDPVQIQKSIHVVVVGAGVAGLELALSIQGRWKDLCTLTVTVLDAHASNGTILPTETFCCRRKLLEILDEKLIHLKHYDCGIKCIDDQKQIHLNDGNNTTIKFDYCIWATGAGAHDLAYALQKRGLQLDDHGWIQVNRYLQSVSHPYVFAAGDCASHPAHPPKAGVYAVRSGPILIQNLTQYLLQLHGNDNSPEKLTEFVPQPDFLKLLACGDGTSLGFRFGIPMHGPWVWTIKNEIDQSFMDLFRVDKLPPIPTRSLLDISQYDAAYACREHANVVDAKLAAQLLWRNDDEVDYKVNWKIVRDMVCMKTYRQEVLQHWHGTERMIMDLLGQTPPLSSAASDGNEEKQQI